MTFTCVLKSIRSVIWSIGAAMRETGQIRVIRRWDSYTNLIGHGVRYPYPQRCIHHASRRVQALYLAPAAKMDLKTQRVSVRFLNESSPTKSDPKMLPTAKKDP